ncbi:unnamed protein product [Musa banksii]
MAFAASPAALMTTSSSPRLLSKRSSLASSESLFVVAAAHRTRALQRRLRPGRSGGLGCRCLFGLGVPELVVIAGVAALVFGPKNLPEIGRSIGKTVKSFQQVCCTQNWQLRLCSAKTGPSQNFLSVDEPVSPISILSDHDLINRLISNCLSLIVQAAKEFETELKKDPEDSSKSPPAESPKAVSSEDEKKELETSGTTDSS